ncbi:TetR/AcrR family transcriptional regulator [Streptantibioticus ferralitis]|uniref:TetR family transcriptional regulator C-terminal domain-containing protein n=1 Tax=Streptantibioticus ferralitis TaxID=236510 RepID=A0ABT5Z745_9ACTN|nr:TetR/AcrR family transcriptional regulator [Streptantibioticus ferralitis]MDF2258855.1 TetR family transcriptional regulator C-terminal domain-containing protein [Streptantibioticus ferralitis]
MARPSLREHLIDAASERFHEYGFNGSGIKDITDAAGAPKGSFYNHFDSKESMAVEVMSRYGETRELGMLADKSVAPMERIRRHFVFLSEDLEQYGYTRGCMFGNFGAELSTQSPTIRDEVGRRLGSWESLLASVLEEARAAGELASGVDAVVLARFLVSAWEGAAMQAKVVRGSAPLDDFFAVFDSMTA